MASADESNLLGPALPILWAAIELGGRAADTGDVDGASDLYACAARLARKVRGLSEIADFRLERALDECESITDGADRAGILRSAFDSLLPDLEPTAMRGEPLAAAQNFIEMAISIGAPAYNSGDRQGCFDVYSCTARMILATIKEVEPARQRLKEALEECTKLDDADRQAWAMRHGFDAVLGMGDRGAAAFNPGDMRRFLAMAVQLGAPAFDLGDTRGCYEVYACAARLLVSSLTVNEAAKQQLREALAQAALTLDTAKQAWILRESFNSILGSKGGETEKAGSADDDEST